MEHHGDASTQAMLPWEVFTHLLAFKDTRYEMALKEGMPSALLIKDLKFISIDGINIVRPRPTGSLHFIKHGEVCPRVVYLLFDLKRPP